MKLPFTPIAQKEFRFASALKTIDITFALSAPYKRLDSDGFGSYACKIVDSDDAEFAREIPGHSEFEALELTLIHFRNYIKTLQESGAGKLLNPDGSPFTDSSADVFAACLEKSRKSKPLLDK